MILEVAILDVKPELTVEFEAAFETASTIIETSRDAGNSVSSDLRGKRRERF